MPLFFDLRTFGLTDTVWAVALPQVAQSVAFGTYWMRAYFKGVNPSIMDAARVDGASKGRILISILVPMGRPAITTMVVLMFMWTWNEFLIPLVMSPSGEFRTAPLGLAFFQGQYTQGTALLAAAAVHGRAARGAALLPDAAPLHQGHARGSRQGIAGPQWLHEDPVAHRTPGVARIHRG